MDETCLERKLLPSAARGPRSTVCPSFVVLDTQKYEAIRFLVKTLSLRLMIRERMNE